MKPEEEVELVDACRRRDAGAFKKLYEVYAPRMYGVCLRYSRCVDDAEDLLHDSFIKVFNSINNLRSDNSLGPWIRSIVINTAVSRYRHDSYVSDVDITDDMVTYDPSGNIYDSLDVEVILGVVQQLPPAYRTAFNLCEIEGFSYLEAAQQMGISETTVRSHLSRAKSMLAAKLRDYRH